MVTVNSNGDAGDKGKTGGVFAVTNWTSDYAMDCNTASDAEICDVLATLISDLIRQGILKGSVATA